jgi:CheY-like chemotaxis protein
MEDNASNIRGLINDLLRSLSAALVHVDDLIMKVERNSNAFPDAILTNEQLSRSIELFLDLRSECNYLLEHLFVDNHNSLNKSAKLTISKFRHGMNELYTTVLGSCDLLLIDNNREQIMDNITLIRNSIENHMHSDEPINDNISVKDIELVMNSQKLIIMNYDQSNKHKINSEKKNKRILIVEDDTEVRKITSLALYKNGYEVFESEDGESAKNIFNQGNANVKLCLIDLGLPDMDGAQLANELILNHKKLDILFTSGQDRSILNRHKDMIKKYTFLQKPYRIAKLLNVVENLFQHHYYAPL